MFQITFLCKTGYRWIKSSMSEVFCRKSIQNDERSKRMSTVIAILKTKQENVTNNDPKNLKQIYSKILVKMELLPFSAGKKQLNEYCVVFAMLNIKEMTF